MSDLTPTLRRLHDALPVTRAEDRWTLLQRAWEMHGVPMPSEKTFLNTIGRLRDRGVMIETGRGRGYRLMKVQTI